MRSPQMKRDELVALLTAKAGAPPPEANKLLVRHLECKESIHLAGAVREAMNRFSGTDSLVLPPPSEILPPLG
jgi:hypothetical protein